MSAKHVQSVIQTKLGRFFLVPADIKTDAYLKGCNINCDCKWRSRKYHYEWRINSGHYAMPEEK